MNRNHDRDNWTETSVIIVNTRLLTRDGRRIGNAIVQSVDHNEELNQATYRCLTDYGNPFVFTAGEIRELFYVADVAGPDHKHFMVIPKGAIE